MSEVATYMQYHFAHTIFFHGSWRHSTSYAETEYLSTQRLDVAPADDTLYMGQRER